MFLSLGATEPRGPTDDFWYMAVGAGSAAGYRVTPELALKLTTVYACVRVLSETLAQLPCILYRRLDRGKERATEHPLYYIVGSRPNDMHTSFEWREMKQAHLALRGNGFSEILFRGSKITGLKPLHPDFVRVEDAPNGSWRYYVRETPAGNERVIRHDEMLHIRGLVTNGVLGLNPIEAQRESLGFSLAAQDHGARFYRNGAVMPGWIEYPGSFKDQEAKTRFRDAWRLATTGARKFETPVLEYGMKYHEIPIKHTDAQYLETLKHHEEVAARIFRVQPHKVGILDKATFSNIEQQAIEFVVDTMMPWLRRWEQRLNESLLTEIEQQEYFFEFLVDGLLRGDSNSRAVFYGRGIQDGWFMRNEVREKENLNPLPGLDEPLEPLNMTRAADRGSDNDRRRQPPEGEKEAERAQALQLAACQRVVRKEVNALRKITKLDNTTARRDVAMSFYATHPKYVVETALAPIEIAMKWCARQRALLNFAIDADALEEPITACISQFLDELDGTGAIQLSAMIRQGDNTP